MNFLKTLVLTTFFIIYYQISFADCGHCFTIAKIKIVYNNGNEEVSNFKFFRQYVLDNNEIEPRINQSIRKYFSSKTDTIQVVDSIYQIENIPAFIDKKSERNILFNKVKDIILMEWTSIGGAFELPSLPSNTIKRILESKSFLTETKIFHVHDEVYIYTDSKLSSDEFSFLIKESYNYAEPTSSVRIKIEDRKKNKYPNKLEINRGLKSHFSGLNKKIDSISNISINAEINEYFQIFKNDLKKYREYLELVHTYLNTKEIDYVQNFVFECIEKKHIKNILLDIINQDTNTERKTYELTNASYLFENGKVLNRKFDQILKNENVIVLIVSWD
ncbi:hypothetical protein [uncultured Aquimarina sp.]|uniref:hypothetical protein n=1 Tax=uncultured Aquimarina sp. TaxID=575652 RepID=UPI002604671B|nr:hypothetical protein [uncultured Aquimarina sp.]